MPIIFRCQKFSLRVLLSICLIFCQFQTGVAYKNVACSEAYCRKISLMLRVSHSTSIEIKLFILFLKKIVEKLLIIAYPQGKISLKKLNSKRKIPPENYPRKTLSPRKQPPSNKAILQEIQVVFQAQHDRMNYQTS